MTRCVNCGEDLTLRRDPRVRVLGGLEVCDVRCATEFLSDPPIIGLHQCAGCGEELSKDSDTPPGYELEHCARCVREIEQRSPRRAV